MTAKSVPGWHSWAINFFIFFVFKVLNSLVGYGAPFIACLLAFARVCINIANTEDIKVSSTLLVCNLNFASTKMYFVT